MDSQSKPSWEQINLKQDPVNYNDSPGSRKQRRESNPGESRNHTGVKAVKEPNMSAAPTRKYLLTFDFDETIVNENSDDSVIRVAPSQELPESLRQTFQEGFYNQYMQRVFEYLGDKGVRKQDYLEVYEKIPFSPGMLELFGFLTKNKELFEIILISDANMFGIEGLLRSTGYLSLFYKIFSNPAYFDNRGYLTLEPYHSHDCPQCPANMCKRKILSEYLTERSHEGVEFEKLFYVGDGANDFCPSIVLTSTDVAFPRKNYPMHRMIQKMEETQPGVYQAKVVPWDSADVILQYLRGQLKQA